MYKLLTVATVAGFALVVAFQQFMPAPTSYVDVPVKVQVVER